MTTFRDPPTDVSNYMLTEFGCRGRWVPEDPGYEFLRIMDKEIANGGCKPYWMTSEFFEEERYQYKLVVYNSTTLFDKFLIVVGIHHDDYNVLRGQPKREDGSTITYHDMKSDSFYRVKKFRICNVCGKEYEIDASPSLWCEDCRKNKNIIIE